MNNRKEIAMWPTSCQWMPTLPSLPDNQTDLFSELSTNVDGQFHEVLQSWLPAFYVSPWLKQQSISHPEILESLLKEGIASSRNFEVLFSELEDFDDEIVQCRVLRQLRLKEMLRITLRDLLSVTNLENTLFDLSHLSFQFVQVANKWARTWMEKNHGKPKDSNGREQHLVVLGMGKMGGLELNFSSDIDLIFFYPDKGQSDGRKPLDNQEYFLRQGRRIIKLLGENTVDGIVYRVDMRLRPYGKAGALALSFGAAEDYYHSQGREWERYAMIKAIPLTGDKNDIDAYQNILRPFVFRRYLDFSAIQSLRELKVMIKAQVLKKGMENNIKLGRGGIREIEFIGQAFQLIYGGKDPDLQIRGIIPVLSILADRNILPSQAVEELQSAYTFLRLTENRIQMMQDRQTHLLPVDESEQARLAYSMGFDRWESFLTSLSQHRDNVAEQFEQVFAENEEAAPSESVGIWKESIPEEAIVEFLRLRNFKDEEQAWELLKAFKHSSLYKKASPAEKQRVDKVVPMLLDAVCDIAQDKDAVMERGLKFIQAIVHRSIYLVMLAENDVLLRRVIMLMDKSAWIAEHVTLQPHLLDQLLDECLIEKVKRRPALDEDLDTELLQCEGEADQLFEDQLNSLRRFKRAYALNVATLDITDKLPLMKVSDHLTDVAESCVNVAHRMAWVAMTERHGFPHVWRDGQAHNPSMAVIGYGKMGGIEMGYSSDLDVVFLHDSQGERAMTSGREDEKGVIDNTLFFARMAQKLTTILNTRMITGELYEVDTRLRPDGASGEAVKSLAGFEKYQKEKAWTWEHQALVRARFVCGQPNIEKAFLRIRHEVLTLPRDETELRKEVIDMREKMREHLGGKEGKISLKQDRGGLTDIEFMVQFAVLNWAQKHPELTKWTDNIRILEVIGQVGVMEMQDCATLIESYRTIRAKIHRLALNREKAVLSPSEIELEVQNAMEWVADYWQQWMLDPA